MARKKPAARADQPRPLKALPGHNLHSPAGASPALQRHGVRTLVDHIGEPLSEVLAEFYLRPDHDPLVRTP